jgi:glycosyltransferase involved in cell wall biosynthesis
MRQELGLAADEFCIGCIGNLFPVKGHLTALEGMAEFSRQCRNWRLLLIGDGPERAKLESFLAGHPEWAHRVTFLGLSHRVPELMRALDVYVLPSIAEGISNSLLEAMASGVPVVATATGGNPEVVVDGDSGLLFPVGDGARLAAHLLRLYDEAKLREDLSARARRRVNEEFSLESMVGRYARLYENLGRKTALPVHVAAGA